jgi:tRNA pseudouridine synthase 10
VREMLPAFSCTSYRFSSSGREDLDVRMLGNGRTFVFELMQARRVLDEHQLLQLEHRINAGTQLVEARGLRLASKAEFAAMKRGVESKRKLYRCLVWTSRSLTASDLSLLCSTSPLTVQQRTPIRVLHRRSALTRAKVIHEMKAERVMGEDGGSWCTLDLLTSAGTYVKEFVHGDRGRTTPSVASILGCASECVQLDVMGVRDSARTHCTSTSASTQKLTEDCCCCLVALCLLCSSCMSDSPLSCSFLLVNTQTE